MIIMAVDLGKARTGIAASDKTEYLASPVKVISEHNKERLLQKVCETAQEIKAELVVVGLPKNMDGSEGFLCCLQRNWVLKLNSGTKDAQPLPHTDILTIPIPAAKNARL